MDLTDVLKPLGVFAVVIVVILGATAIGGVALGGSSTASADGQTIDGQSPSFYDPAAVNVDVDPEQGEIQVDDEQGQKRVLIDTSHGNAVDRDALEPVLEAMYEAGHDVDIGAQAGGADGGFGSSGGYNATLQEYDAVLVIAPTEPFTEAERAGLMEYTEGGGRLVVLGEPTQLSGGGGLFSGPTTVSFGADDLTGQYGAAMGAEGIYNLDDSRNDNNFKAIYGTTDGSDSITEGVGTVTFERSGYLVTARDSDAESLVVAADGTRTLETRREGQYTLAVRNDNMVFVADSDFMDEREVYDADNEVFVSNLLDFMVSGDKPDDVPETGGDGGDGGF